MSCATRADSATSHRCRLLQMLTIHKVAVNRDYQRQVDVCPIYCSLHLIESILLGSSVIRFRSSHFIRRPT